MWGCVGLAVSNHTLTVACKAVACVAQTLLQQDQTIRKSAAGIVCELGRFVSIETMTGSVWIDGKPIYRKVITFATLPNGVGIPNVDVAHGIAGVSAFINQYGWWFDGTWWLRLPHVSFTSGNNLLLLTNATYVRLASGIDFSSYAPAHVVLEYTK